MPIGAPSATTEILILAGNTGDVALFRVAAANSRVNVVDVCPDILVYLRRQGRFAGCRRPDLIVLDIDLSKPDECAVLEEIKRTPEFRRIPLIVLAANESSNTIIQAYDLYANAYIIKPEDPLKFVEVIRATFFFWLNLARLPEE